MFDGDRVCSLICRWSKSDKVIFATDVSGLILDYKVDDIRKEAKGALPRIGIGMGEENSCMY